MASDDRRSFFAVVTTVVAGGLSLLTPLAAGLTVFFSPLFRRAKSPLVRITLLGEVPDDGVPRNFSVITDRIDAWNRYPAQRIGAVYLIRQPGEQKPVAFSAKCPHAGCFIGYAPGEQRFQCPCHTSAFHLDGTRLHGDQEVAPRGMDTLPVELREIELAGGQHATEVWVEFIDYQTGRKEKIPTA